jgi:hypothetical protein
VDVVRLNLGGGKEVIALGRRDVLRIMEGPIVLVARLRVIIAGVSLSLVNGPSFSACTSGGEERMMRRGVGSVAASARDIFCWSLLERMLVVIIGVGDSNKTLVDGALDGIVHLRGL